MKPLATLAALALTGCMAAEPATRAPDMLTLDNWRAFTAAPGCIRPPAGGGNVQAAFNLVEYANRTGRCVQFDGPAYSANVMIAAMARDVRVADPNARLFFMKHVQHAETGEVSVAANVLLYAHAGIVMCWADHEASGRDWTAYSLNQLRRGCI